MTQRKFRYLTLAWASSVAFGVAVACGGLDNRDVTRVPDGAGTGATSGMSAAGVTGIMANDGGAPPAAGGAEGGGAVTENPFGGETFAGGAPPMLEGAPEVVDVLPADGASDADPTVTIGLKFSEGLDASTVTAASVRLLDGAAPIAGKLAYAGVTATLKPSARLSLLATYEIQATQDITDISGARLKQPFSSKFTVRDGSFGDRKSVLNDPAAWAGEQDVGSDAEGNVLVVWSSQDPLTFASTGCWAARYDLRTGWAAPIALSEATEECDTLRLVVSPSGDALVAWFTGIYPNQAVRARRYVSGAWEPKAITVDSPPGTQSGVADLAVGIGGGQGLLGWVRGVSDGPPNNTSATYLYLEYAALNAAWPATPSIGHVAYSSAASNDSLQYVGASVDPQGNALVVFNFLSDSTDPTSPKGVYFTRKAPNGDWLTSAKIPSSVPANYTPVVASDGDGAMAVWANYDAASSAFQLLASRYTKTKQFSAPVQIQDPDLHDSLSVSPVHALSSDGKSFFATWTQAVGAGRNAYVSRYAIASAKWDALPTAVSDGVTLVGDVSSVGVDAHGNAIVAFEEGDSTATEIAWARFSASSGRWSTAAPAAETDMWFRSPYVSVASNGAAALLFSSRHFIGHMADVAGGELRFFQ